MLPLIVRVVHELMYVVAQDFWYRQHTCFDIRVFDLFASSYSLWVRKEVCLWWEGERSREGIFFTCGVFCKWRHATTIYKKLASILAYKWALNYNQCLFWLRCRVSFSLLRPTIVCFWGHHSSAYCPATPNANVDLAYSEGRVYLLVCIRAESIFIHKYFWHNYH